MNGMHRDRRYPATEADREAIRAFLGSCRKALWPKLLSEMFNIPDYQAASFIKRWSQA